MSPTPCRIFGIGGLRWTTFSSVFFALGLCLNQGILSSSAQAEVDAGLPVENLNGHSMDQAEKKSGPPGSSDLGGGIQMSPEQAQQLMKQLEGFKKQMEEHNKALKQLEKESL